MESFNERQPYICEKRVILTAKQKLKLEYAESNRNLIYYTRATFCTKYNSSSHNGCLYLKLVIPKTSRDRYI